MPSVQYGQKTIQYTVQENEDLSSHYITVDKETGVVLKGAPVTQDVADRLILKKAKWILEKLELVKATEQEIIVTGSRILYLGKRYYADVVYSSDQQGVSIQFNHSQFRIVVNPNLDAQPAILDALEAFYRAKATKKLLPRLKKLTKLTGLIYTDIKVRKMEKRWASCTASNQLIFNYELIKLPYSLIDYVIVHELCHTKVKDHSKEFWAELAKHIPNWKELDAQVAGMKL